MDGFTSHRESNHDTTQHTSAKSEPLPLPLVSYAVIFAIISKQVPCEAGIIRTIRPHLS